MSVLTDIKNRGVTDTFFLVCDGLKGLPDVVGNVWPLCLRWTVPLLLSRRAEDLSGNSQSDERTQPQAD